MDTLVLGCTHYPLLREVIGGFMGPQVSLVDSGLRWPGGCAATCGSRARGGGEPDRFLPLVRQRLHRGLCRLGSRFLGRPVTEPVEQVSVEAD